MLLTEEIFSDFARDVMRLHTTKRQEPDQTHFMELLEKARCEHPESIMMPKDARFYVCFIFYKKT